MYVGDVATLYNKRDMPIGEVIAKRTRIRLNLAGMELHQDETLVMIYYKPF